MLVAIFTTYFGTAHAGDDLIGEYSREPNGEVIVKVTKYQNSYNVKFRLKEFIGPNKSNKDTHPKKITRSKILTSLTHLVIVSWIKIGCFLHNDDGLITKNLCWTNAKQPQASVYGR